MAKVCRVMNRKNRTSKRNPVALVKRLPLLLAVGLGLASIADAEQGGRGCRVLFLNGPDDAPEKLQLFDGKTSREVELPRMNFSKVYPLPGGALDLRLLPDPVVDPAKVPAGAPSVKVGEDIVDFYLLVTSDPANTVAPVRLQVINAGGDRLKAGQMMWFNLTKVTVGGALGSEKLLIAPGGRLTMNAPASGNQDYLVNLGYRLPDNEQVYPLCETKWRHDPRSRSVAFIFNEAGSRTPRVLVFHDFRAPPPEKRGER